MTPGQLTGAARNLANGSASGLRSRWADLPEWAGPYVFTASNGDLAVAESSSRSKRGSRRGKWVIHCAQRNRAFPVGEADPMARLPDAYVLSMTIARWLPHTARTPQYSAS